ncbi:hypothetical protein [Cylindrospermopsis raciborskii]|uniref:hypothetical protein n=1 Tax=Cylindrospermopsis raciborskii TaxID=77022 RepID=UPI003DA5ECAC
MCFTNITLPTGDCEALPTGDRSPLGTFHVPFPVGKRLTVNVFRQRMNQLFQGGRDIWRGIAQHALWAITKYSIQAIAKHALRAIALHSIQAIALSDYPPIPSEEKNLNMLKGDCAALPLGDRSPPGRRIYI